MNPLLDEKAPYALALLVTMLGWLLNSAVADADKSLIISYELTRRDDLLLLDIRNQSLSLPMHGVQVTLRCQSGDCFTRRLPQTRGDFSIDVQTSVWSVNSNPVDAPPGDETDSLKFLPEIPARSSLAITLGLMAGATTPKVVFSADPDDSSIHDRTPEFENGYSLKGLVFANWFWIILWGGVALIIVVLSWTAIIQRRKEVAPK